MASQFIVEISDDGSAKWRTGIDAGGSGYMCSSDSEFYCLMLEGAWNFAIPHQLVDEPKIGTTWELDGVDFELLEVVGLRAKQDGEPSLVISTLVGKTEITFNYSASEGIQFISCILDFSDEETAEFISSVWVNTAMLKEID